MHGSKPVSVLFGVLAVAAMTVTTWIIHRGGTMMGTTEVGQQLLAYAAIVVHLGGVVVFGMATGNSLKEGKRGMAALCGLMMLGAAVYSGWQIASFATAELISTTRAREIAEERAKQTHDAQIEAGKERLKAQAKLAEQHLKWIQSTTEETKGRTSRKDYMESGSKLITDMGKGHETAAPPPLPPPTQPPIKGEALAEWLANAYGWRLSALQAMPTLQLALMILLIEVTAWPLAAYYWRKEQGVAAPAAFMPAPPTPLEPAPTPDPVDVEQARKALPAPRPARDPKAITVRSSPSPEWRALLDKLDFPPPGARHKGPRRAKDTLEYSVLKFLAWLGAYKESGEFSREQIAELYVEFCAMDHREQSASPPRLRGIKWALESLGTRIVSHSGTTWTIEPPPLDKLTQLLQRRGALPDETPGRSVIKFAPRGGDAA